MILPRKTDTELRGIGAAFKLRRAEITQHVVERAVLHHEYDDVVEFV